MTLKIKVGTDVVEAKPKIKVNGSWVDAISGFVKVDGSWQEFYRLGGSEEGPFAPLQLTASDAQTNDQFGRSVALDGTRLVVGAPEEGTAADNAGKVYIYEWNTTTSTYDEVATLTASDAEEWDGFGWSVTLDGTRLVVGAAYKANGAGKVYVYEWNTTTSTYDEVATLTASDAEEWDRFGFSVALDDTRLVVGAYGESTIDYEAGKVYVYDWNGTAYVEVGTITASDAQHVDYFGTSVAVDGTRLVVGAIGESTAGEAAGKVYIYDWNGTAYDEVSTITASDAQANDQFGSSVSVDGTRLVVGASEEDTAAMNAGKVYIYEWNGTEYVEVGILTASDAEENDKFGTSVALSGTRLAVGAPNESTAADHAGKVYIYYFDGTIYNPNDPDPIDPQPEGEPFAPLQLTASDAEVDDQFGSSVAVDGTRLVVGATGESTAADYAGKVYIYEWDGSTYVEVGTLTASDAEAFDNFGQSVALDGTRLVVGANGESTAGSYAGKVYIYDWNETTSTYTEVATLTASDAEPDDYFGTSVAVDGTRLVVGAPFESTADSYAGKVYIYDWNGTSYVEVGTLTASDAWERDQFGQSVVVDGTRLVVGATREDSAGNDTGSVYIYDWNDTTSTYDEVAKLTASDARNDDRYGESVALDGTRLVVGARGEDTAGADAGKVYIYEWNDTTSTYVEVTTLTASDAENYDYFGASVSLDGARLVVGAYGEGMTDSSTGKVYIYYFDGIIDEPIKPDPIELLQLTASDAQSDDYFGASVSLDGARLVVGAPWKDTTGKVYVYDWNDTTSTYDEVATLTADVGEWDEFGWSVALDGTRLVVGVTYGYSSAGYAGKVYIYDWNGTSYVEVGTLTASDAKEWDSFGYSVALDGTRLVVGAPYRDTTIEDTTIEDTGKVYVYEWNGTAYVEVVTLTASDGAEWDYFGGSVSLDGTRLVVGAYGGYTSAGYAGKAYVYDWNGMSYDEVATLTASDEAEWNGFGISAVVDGTRLVVGANGEDTAGENAGKVYIYEWDGSTYVEVGTLTASDIQSEDAFGVSLALDGTKLVVGAYGEDTAGENAGKVYIYSITN